MNNPLCCLAACGTFMLRDAERAARSAAAPLFEFVQNVPFCQPELSHLPSPCRGAAPRTVVSQAERVSLDSR
jgi:hypothetical protein